MKRALSLMPLCAFLAVWISISSGLGPQASLQGKKSSQTYLGFDRNIYPGDDALAVLRRTFAFTGYWLSPPPGETTNTWTGKREILLKNGFGFLVLYRGRETREIKNPDDGFKLGLVDGPNAAERAKAEGFARGATIFLDIEEGGRLPAPYHIYLLGWSMGIRGRGYHPGVYCSGIAVNEGDGVTITTADDIRKNAASSDVSFWVYNDSCPPSPGCVFPENPSSPAESGISDARVWQYAQSPRRKEFTAHCPAGYHKDGNCYAPRDKAHTWFLDLNSATTPDPSNGR